jgi:predicted transcriptional regulator
MDVDKKAQKKENKPLDIQGKKRGRWHWVPEYERHFEGTYVRLFQHALDVVAMDKAISGEGLRIWMKLLAALEDENYMQLQQSTIAEQMGLQKTNVSRAFRQLMEAGYLEEGPKSGRAKSYRVNPELAWKGSGPEYTETMAKRGKLRLIKNQKEWLDKQKETKKKK